jgi:hypothetical protein
VPPGTTIINATGATYSNNHLSWEVYLQPGQPQFFQVVLQLPSPVAMPPHTSTTASAYEPVNAVWLQFSQTPVISQMTSSPPPQIQPIGFNNGSFALGLQALIPGIYDVDTTSDFINWNPVLTVINDAGYFQVLDSSAHFYPVRFYRASRSQ